MKDRCQQLSNTKTEYKRSKSENFLKKEVYVSYSEMAVPIIVDSTSGASIERPLSQNCCPVIVDIETCGLSPSADIIQIAARKGESSYECFILPVGSISNEVSKITGFTKVCGQLLYKGKSELTTTPKLAAQGLIGFLRNLSSEMVLVGHNIIRFDGPRLVNLMQEELLLSDFVGIVYGLSDTLKLIGKDEPCKRQDVLARKFLGRQWQPLLDDVHNATVDCKILEGLLQAFDVTEEQLLKNAVSLTKLCNDTAERVRKKKVKSTLQILKNTVSPVIIGKMASADVTFHNLVEQYHQSGAEGVKLLLGQNVGGKPEVTSNTKIVNRIIQFLEVYVK